MGPYINDVGGGGGGGGGVVRFLDFFRCYMRGEGGRDTNLDVPLPILIFHNCALDLTWPYVKCIQQSLKQVLVDLFL